MYLLFPLPVTPFSVSLHLIKCISSEIEFYPVAIKLKFWFKYNVNDWLVATVWQEICFPSIWFVVQSHYVVPSVNIFYFLARHSLVIVFSIKKLKEAHVRVFNGPIPVSVSINGAAEFIFS